MSLSLTTPATILGLAEYPSSTEDDRAVLGLNVEIDGAQYKFILITNPGQSIQQALEYLAEVGYLTKNKEKFILQVPPWVWTLSRVKRNIMLVYVDDYERLKRITTLIEKILERGSVKINCRPCGGCCGNKYSLRVSPVEYFALSYLKSMFSYRSLCKVLRDFSNLFCSEHKHRRGSGGATNAPTQTNSKPTPPGRGVTPHRPGGEVEAMKGQEDNSQGVNKPNAYPQRTQ